MSTSEFSIEFDVLYNNITNNLAPGLSEYEKSVFLTKAQEELVISFYTGSNSVSKSFEKNEEVKRYLSPLIKSDSITASGDDYMGVSDTPSFFNLPDDVWFILYESAEIAETSCEKQVLTVTPISLDEYHKIKKNPFRGSNGRRILRIETGCNVVELTSKNIDYYNIKYLKKPKPIILETLPDNLKIDSIAVKTECELNSALHRTILERAVQLAIQSITTAGENKNN